MAQYNTIPQTVDEDAAAPLIAEAPKANHKSTALIAAVCLMSAVAGTAVPSAVKALSFSAQGNGDLPTAVFSQDVQICDNDGYCLGPCGYQPRSSGLGVPNKGDSGLNVDGSDLTIYSKSSPRQGIQKFTYEEYSPCNGCNNLRRLRFKSKDGSYNGCVALYARNGGYANGGSKIQMQECIEGDHQGGQRQNIEIPGGGRKDASGKLSFYLTNNLCIGGPKGGNGDNKHVYSDQCRTNYKVMLV